MKIYIYALTACMGLGLTACGSKELPPSAKTTRAPMSAEETGYLVMKNPNQISWSNAKLDEGDFVDLLNQYPEMKVRVINARHGIFEVHGVPSTYIQSLLGPRVDVRKNQYFRIGHTEPVPRSLGALRKMFYNANMDEQKARDFLNSCLVADPSTAPRAVMTTSTPRDRFNFTRLIELGATVEFSSKHSVSVDDSPLEFLWIVQSTSFSRQGSRIYSGTDIKVTPDTVGEYRVILVVKDQRQVCNMAMEAVYATANPPYDANNAMAPELIGPLDKEDFWHLYAMDAPQAWELSQGEGVTVAILDSGVNYNNPFLAANMAVNEGEIPGNGIDDDGNGFIDDVVGYDFVWGDGHPFDDFGHGSHCAGIAASPIFGIAPKAKIMAVKVGASGMDIGSVIGGVLYAVDNGAKVLNMSFGANIEVPGVREAFEYAQRKGVVLVAAAGNGDANGIGYNIDQYPQYPASYKLDNMIAVAATNKEGALTIYSNFGPKSVHVAAPGGDQLGLVLSANKDNPGGYLLYQSAGTSMAAPAVVGVIAQMFSLNPQLTPLEVRDILMTTGKPADFEGKIITESAVNSLNALRSLTDPEPMP